MKVVDKYSHLNGEEFLLVHHKNLYKEILSVVEAVDANKFRTKISKEKGKMGKPLYPPKEINKRFRDAFGALGWEKLKEPLPLEIAGLESKIKPFKEIDFVKERVACEVQFGKYFSMQYDLQKFQYFYNKNRIDAGVEIVPMSALARQMSSGVAYYELLVGDLTRMGRSFPPVPVWAIGIDIGEE